MKHTDLEKASLDYHELPKPGKIALAITKPTASQIDLSLAYTPGVAVPVEAIVANPDDVYKYTSKGNLVAVITNGSAVLGLGNVGPLASKPVMEGKAVLLKQFADIDVFDIEMDAQDPNVLISAVKCIAPTFGGILLEDIKAPECFYIEENLLQTLDIPVFHDDQHGTAIVVAAGLLNALDIQNKKIQDIKIVCIGAGAAGIASMKLLLEIGAKRENIYLLDSKGVITTQRDDLNNYKKEFAQNTTKISLEDALQDADVFIGLSRPNLLNTKMLLSMSPNPIIFALANPSPEIQPELAMATRKDLIIATGRSDYPNQVNNLLCFPYIFRGALDAKAKRINKEMRIAAVEAIRKIVHQSNNNNVFGKDYIIPQPFDVRLKEYVTKAVYKTALATNAHL